MKRLIFIILVFSFAVPRPCAAARPKGEVRKGNELYKKGEYGGALKAYEDALEEAPDSDIVNYDIGAALYKTEDYEASIGHFERSLVSEDESLEQKANYNIGNAKYKYGISKEGTDLDQAIAFLEQSLRHYERAIEINMEDEDARHNYEFVKEELKRLKEMSRQKQEQRQQSQGEESDEKKEEQQSGQGAKDEKKDQEEKRQEGQTEEQDEREQADSGGGEEEREGKPQQTGPQEAPEDISEKEARAMLDHYSEEEEPKGLYTEKLPPRRPQRVLKDW